MTDKFAICNMGLNGSFIKENGKIMDIERVVDLLNEQHEQIEDLKDANVRCCNEYSYFHKRMMQVEKENEQLKKELKRCRDWLNSDKNDYQLTLAFIKSKGYSLKDVLEYEKELEE